MIDDIKCYTAECNVCKSDFEHPYHGWNIFASQDDLEDGLRDNDWHVDGLNCYCPNCHNIDGSDNVIIKSN